MNKLVSLILLLSASAFAQPTNLPCDVASQLIVGYSTISSNSITLLWPGNANATARSVARRVYTNNPAFWTSWSNLYSSVVSADQSGTYIDTNVSTGVHYEYEIGMLLTNVVCDGATNRPNWYYEYISTGIEVPTVATRGNVCLLVESGVAAALASRLTILTNDLVMSGYKVYRHDIAADDVGSGTWSNSVVATKTTVTNDFSSDPTSRWTLFIVGHVPVPYSGDSSPGGHLDNLGAHPVDWYYTITNAAAWTDSTVNDTSSGFPAQKNIPSDGKFDQSDVPAIPRMQVGRVDLRNLPAFPSTETQLLQQYLDRDHQWRIGNIQVRNLGLINSNNNAGLINRGKPVDEHNTLASFFGTTNQTMLGAWLGDGSNVNGYISAANSGQGNYNDDLNIGTTTNFVYTNLYVPFTRTYGSYYGDWDTAMVTNSFLQAPLANAGYALNVYYGPNVMNMDSPAMGETWGQKLLESAANNSMFANRYKSGAYIQGGTLFDGAVSLRSYISLLGDPTLNMYPVKPPSNVVVQANGTNAAIYWSASPDTNIVGYYVYRAPSTNRNAFTVLTSVPTNAPLTDVGGMDTNNTWWVRAVKREGGSNRSFNALSQGSLWTGTLHTNYYVMTNGSDANPGTSYLPLLTVQKGVDLAYEGDRVIVGPGTFEGVIVSKRNGTNAPIIIEGAGVATLTNSATWVFDINHSNIWVQGFTITGPTNASARQIYLDRNASFFTLSNNVLDACYTPSVYAIQWNTPTSQPFGYPVASGATIISNVIKHVFGCPAISSFGDNNLIKGNLIYDCPQADFINLWGISNVFTANICSNSWQDTNSANHSDFLQTFGVNGYGCKYVTVSGNIIVGVTNGGMTEIATTQITSSLGAPVSNITFINNLFINMGIQASCTIPNVSYYNNTFVRCNFYNKGSAIGWAEASPGSAERADDGQCFNNVFYQCGDLDGVNKLSSGWYNFSYGLTNVAADYNAVIKSNYTSVATNTLHQSIGDPAWNNFAFWENHGFNGGNPAFADESGYGSGWSVGTNSFLYNAGTNLSALFTTDINGKTRPSVGAWTIGAFEAGTSGGSQSTASSTSIGAGATISIGGGSKVYFQ